MPFFVFSVYEYNHSDLVLNKDIVTLIYCFKSLPSILFPWLLQIPLWKLLPHVFTYLCRFKFLILVNPYSIMPNSS